MKKIASILVATDLSAASDHIVRAAASLAALLDARLHLLHAFDLDLSAYALADPDARPGFQDRVRAAQQQLDDQIRRAVRQGVDVASREVAIEVAHRAILARAEAAAADLIVLGPHRRAEHAGFFGTTADRVIRSAEVPCLVVRGPLSLPLGSVIVPIDLSRPARGALDIALAWSAALGAGPRGADARVTALHVMPTAFDVEGFAFDEAVIAPELHREVQAALDRVDVPVQVHEEVRTGDTPAPEILRALYELGADLVVLGTHGYGVVRRALIGSVASAVARDASCPVLLVPPGLWLDQPAREAPDAAEAADGAPQFRVLEQDEVEAILARNNVGRIAYARGRRLDIQPVHYVYHDGWLYGRTSYGAKYEALGESAYRWWPVVFEVDEVEDLFRWRSVVVHGGFYVLPEDGSEAEQQLRATAIDQLRTLIPDTLGADDPVPFRTVLFRIAVQDATGREAAPAGVASEVHEAGR